MKAAARRLAITLAMVAGPAGAQGADALLALGAGTTPDIATESSDRLATVSLTINGLDRGDAVLLVTADARWAATAADLREWGVSQPRGAPLSFGDQRYFPLDALPGYAAQFDAAALTLHLTVGPEAFDTTTVSAGLPPTPAPVETGYGGFLNYDLLAATARLTEGEQPPVLVNAYGDAVVYTPAGALENTFVVRDLGNDGSDTFSNGREYARLETSWRTDLLERMETLTIGDAVGASGSWGRPTRFGGVRLATNFETRPGFVATPQLSFAGEAAVPSVVEVFINGTRTQSAAVPAGPFEITDVPTFGSAGEARLVVTDVLGRQSVMQLPFLTSQQLLRQGLSQYSFEAGLLRETLGLGGDEYGAALGIAQVRHGFSDRVTGEARAEWSENGYAAGLGSSTSLGVIGVLSSAAAFSESDAGYGSLLSLAYERPSPHGLYGAGSLQWHDREFRQLGRSRLAVPVRLAAAGNLGARVWRNASVNVGYVSQSFYDAPGIRILSVGAGTTWRDWHVSLTGSRQDSDELTTFVGLSLSHHFGQRVNGSTLFRARESDTQLNQEYRAQASKGLEEGPSTGWRALVGQERTAYGTGVAAESSERIEAGLSLRNDYATLGAEAARAREVTAARLSAAGAVGIAEGVPFATRTITRSFGLVVEPELAGLPVYVNGQRTAVIDESGHALLPRLAAYSPNLVRVDLNEAPLELEIAEPQLRVSAGHRTGHRIAFNARRVRSALVRLVTRDGAPVPVGAELRVSGDDRLWAVADGGEAFISTPKEIVQLTATWAGGRCAAEVTLPTTPGAAPVAVPCESAP